MQAGKSATWSRPLLTVISNKMYVCKTLITVGKEFASREKRLSICLRANGFSFAEATTAGQLITFGDVEGAHGGSMTDMMGGLKVLFASVGIRPLGYASSELILLSDENVWVPDELYTASANRKYLKFVGAEPAEVMSCQCKALKSTMVFSADEQRVTAFKVAIPGIVVKNQHVKMATLASRSAGHPVVFTHWREGRVDIAACRDGRYLYGNTFRFASIDEALYHIVDVMKSYSLEDGATELLMCGEVDRGLYAQFRPYFPQVSLFNGNIDLSSTPEFKKIQPYRHALILM